MKSLVVFLFFMLSAASTEARRSTLGGGSGPSFSTSERGVFSIGGHYATTSTRLLNTDGSFSSFSGTAYGLGLDVSLFGTGGPGEVRLFLVYDKIQSTSRQVSSYSLGETSVASGLKFFVLQNLFLGAGLGQVDANITQSLQASYKAQATYAVLGLEFNVASSLYLGLQGWYRSGPIRISENPSLSQNGFSDNFAVKLLLIWCPSSILNFSSQ